MPIRTAPSDQPYEYEDMLTRRRLVNEEVRKAKLELGWVNQEIEEHRTKLHKALGRVCDRMDWRGPIARLLVIPDDEDIQEQLDLTREAIAFFTATKTTIVQVASADRRFVIQAAGYREGPASDY